MEKTKKQIEKTIYNLELHETLFVAEELPLRPMQVTPDKKRYEVTRVPGGWVYAFEYPVMGGVDTKLTFVPFSEEFIKKINKK